MPESSARPAAGSAGTPGEVLICWGTGDTWLPVAGGHQPAGLVPGAELRLTSGAGHLVQEDAPAEPTAALTGFPRAWSGLVGTPGMTGQP
ncbi:hypothetical protein Sfulv_43510 [Streptomyces fulvorobeus]|uniref:Pimeloyl-ACP methyl ester carboxylesterase n=1 Tax=Streptomyces fulvorobeus TaxID=284028 RepID=A0A7J0CAH7_9ACTN|nr:pimeloyl-ACP methyl ester carboxylesterase [Streptomyces fulvorobeus]GFM99540.1 hypothetical protein Sfulv_43510 [Streptomyces fulvorobeus]